MWVGQVPCCAAKALQPAPFGNICSRMAANSNLLTWWHAPLLKTCVLKLSTHFMSWRLTTCCRSLLPRRRWPPSSRFSQPATTPVFNTQFSRLSCCRSLRPRQRWPPSVPRRRPHTARSSLPSGATRRATRATCATEVRSLAAWQYVKLLLCMFGNGMPRVCRHTGFSCLSQAGRSHMLSCRRAAPARAAGAGTEHWPPLGIVSPLYAYSSTFSSRRAAPARAAGAGAQQGQG